jgi:hypothetical protein
MTPAMTSAPLSTACITFRPAWVRPGAAGAAPGAPEYQPALQFQQRFWEQIWHSRRRGYQHTTLTPDLAPMATITCRSPTFRWPTCWSLNAWMAQREQQHFVEFTSQTE